MLFSGLAKKKKIHFEGKLQVEGHKVIKHLNGSAKTTKLPAEKVNNSWYFITREAVKKCAK